MFGGPFLERDLLIDAVLRRNPTLDAARYAWEEAAARPAQVALEHPMVSYSLAPLSINSNKVNYGQEVEISQALPWPGKLRRQRQAAVSDAEVRFQNLEEAKIEMAMVASTLFDDLYVADRGLEINAEHVRLLEELKRSATAQYVSGLLSQQAPLQAEVELAHLAHDEVILRADHRVVVARINALLHRSPSAELPPPAPELPTVSAAAESVHAVPPERLEELALGRRPEIAAAAAEVRARAADVSVAALAGYPDFGIMGSYNSMWGEEEHRWMTGLSISLPLWRERVRASQTESEARLAVAERQVQALHDQIRSEVRQAYERTSEAHHVVELFLSRLLPAARDQLRAARAGVEAGIDSFLSLIEAEKNLRDVELGYEEARANLDRRLAELARQLGCLPGGLLDLIRPLATRAPVDPVVPGETL